MIEKKIMHLHAYVAGNILEICLKALSLMCNALLQGNDDTYIDI